MSNWAGYKVGDIVWCADNWCIREYTASYAADQTVLTWYAFPLDCMSLKEPDMNFMSERFGLPYDLQRTLRFTLPFHVTFEMFLGMFERDNGLVSFRVAAPSEPIISASVGALD